jgi:hypothetical protein
MQGWKESNRKKCRRWTLLVGREVGGKYRRITRVGKTEEEEEEI